MVGAGAYFDEIADDYESAAAGDGWSVNEHLGRLLAELQVPPGRVLDLGGGTGRTTAVVLQQFPTATVDLVDASAAMIAHAKASLPPSQVRTHVADIEEFHPAADERYDLVVAMGVLEFTPDLVSTLSHVASMLAVGARFVFTYEPVVHALGPQGDVRTRVDLPTGPLTLTRHHSGAVRDALRESGLRATASELFVSYLRGGTAPVIYELVVSVGDR